MRKDASSGRLLWTFAASVIAAAVGCSGGSSGGALSGMPSPDAGSTLRSDATADASSWVDPDSGGAVADSATSNPGPADTGSAADALAGVSVTWGPGCWYVDQGHKYQAMSFQLVAPMPIPLEATLFFTTNCDASEGTDNLNDTGGTTPSGSWTFWFIHHPDMPATSAIWSLGGHSSVCIDYTNAPDC